MHAWAAAWDVFKNICAMYAIYQFSVSFKFEHSLMQRSLVFALSGTELIDHILSSIYYC